MISEPIKRMAEEPELRAQADWQICAVCKGSGAVGTARLASGPTCLECDGLGMVHLGHGG